MKAVVYKSRLMNIGTLPGLNMLKDVKATFKEGGFKGLRKRYGWKVFAGIVVYYLIRDITLYIIIPYLIIDNI